MKRFLGLLVTFSIMLPLLAVNAATPQRGNVALLLDLSGSMNAELEGKTRRDVAIESLKSSVSSIGDKASLGLYAFGTKFDNSPSNKDASCNDIERLVNYGKGNSGAINEVLTGLEAKGWTPLAKAIATIGDDLALFGDSEHHLIILSDGEESCGGDPIAEVEKLKANGVNVIVNTIGLDVDANTKAQLQGIAAAGGGEYFDAADSNALSSSLNNAVATTKLEEQTSADFSVEDTFILGGSSFDDAVQLTLQDLDPEKTFNFPKNLSKAFMTYKLPKELEPGDKLTIGNVFDLYIDVRDDGTISERDTSTYVDIKIFNKRKAAIVDERNAGYQFESTETDIVLTEDMLEDSFLFIGQNEYNISEKTKMYFEIEKAEVSAQEKESENEVSEETSLDEKASDIEEQLAALMSENSDIATLLGSNEEIQESISQNKKELMKTEEGRAILKALGQDVEESFFQQKTMGIKNMYLAGGAAALLLLLVLAIVGLSKRKK